MNNQDQAQGIIRSVADKLADLERGATRQRIDAKTKERRKYDQAHSYVQRRYHTDREAYLAEQTWACAFCGRDCPPAVYPHPLQEGHVLVVRKERCGCQGEREAEQEQAAKAERERRSFDCAEWVVSLSRAGLTDWLTRATFATFQADTPERQRVRETAAQYTRALLARNLGRRCWLVLWGPYGLGKTHLAAAVLHEAIARGLSCRFRVWPQWIESLQATFDGDGNSSQVVAELKQGSIVAIDDIDKQHPTKSGWVEEKLFSALNSRYNAGKPTILTFNRPPIEMVPWLGAAVVDRMLERAFACVEFAGASYRSGRTW